METRPQQSLPKHVQAAALQKIQIFISAISFDIQWLCCCCAFYVPTLQGGTGDSTESIKTHHKFSTFEHFLKKDDYRDHVSKSGDKVGNTLVKWPLEDLIETMEKTLHSAGRSIVKLHRSDSQRQIIALTVLAPLSQPSPKLDLCLGCKSKLHFFSFFFLQLSYLYLSWHFFCPFVEEAARTLRQGDAELMMQEAPASATQPTILGDSAWTDCNTETGPPCSRRHISYLALRSLMAYLATQAFHLVELICVFAFCFAVCSHIHLFTKECASWYKRMSHHCHSIGDRART